jgi:hypothetical protein
MDAVPACCVEFSRQPDPVSSSVQPIPLYFFYAMLDRHRVERSIIVVIFYDSSVQLQPIDRFYRVSESSLIVIIVIGIVYFHRHLSSPVQSPISCVHCFFLWSLRHRIASAPATSSLLWILRLCGYYLLDSSLARPFHISSIIGDRRLSSVLLIDCVSISATLLFSADLHQFDFVYLATSHRSWIIVSVN